MNCVSVFDYFMILSLKGLRTVIYEDNSIYRLLFGKCAYQVKSVKRGNEKKYIGKNRKTNILDWRVCFPIGNMNELSIVAREICRYFP